MTANNVTDDPALLHYTNITLFTTCLKCCVQIKKSIDLMKSLSGSGIG